MPGAIVVIGTTGAKLSPWRLNPVHGNGHGSSAAAAAVPSLPRRLRVRSVACMHHYGPLQLPQSRTTTVPCLLRSSLPRPQSLASTPRCGMSAPRGSDHKAARSSCQRSRHALGRRCIPRNGHGRSNRSTAVVGEGPKPEHRADLALGPPDPATRTENAPLTANPPWPPPWRRPETTAALL